MKTGAERAELDERIRPILRQALKDGFEVMEIVYLLTRILPELTDFGTAMGQLSAAFDMAAIRGEYPKASKTEVAARSIGKAFTRGVTAL